MTDADMFRVPASAYEQHIGRYGPQLAAAFCDFVGIKSGVRALDVGCGPGALTNELARRLGPANVSAAEPSEPFAQACRSRVPGVEVVVAGAQVMPFADAAFDATLSQLVVNFIDDAHAGVREMARVTRAGGVVAACVWDYAGEMTLLRAFWDAAREVAPALAAQHDEGTVMPWCREGELAELWAHAGLREVQSAAVRVRASYTGFDDVWAPFPQGVGPAGAFCAGLDEGDRAGVRDALQRRLGAGDRPFELRARAWAVAGTVA
jgi:SAM-dependent methyltransferase